MSERAQSDFGLQNNTLADWLGLGGMAESNFKTAALNHSATLPDPARLGREGCDSGDRGAGTSGISIARRWARAPRPASRPQAGEAVEEGAVVEEGHALLRGEPGRGFRERLGLDDLGLGQRPVGVDAPARAGARPAAASVHGPPRRVASAWRAARASARVEAGLGVAGLEGAGPGGDRGRAASPRASSAGRGASARGRGRAGRSPRRSGSRARGRGSSATSRANSDGAIMKAATPAKMPNTMCQRWRRTMSRTGSSRRRAAADSSPCRARAGSGTPSPTGSASGSAPSAPTAGSPDRSRRRAGCAPPQARRTVAVGSAPGSARRPSARAGCAMVSPNSCERALGVEARPGREQRELAREIFGPDVARSAARARCRRASCASQSGRGEIAEDAGGEMLARGQVSGPPRR